MSLKSRRIWQTMVISIMISSLLIGSSNNFVFAQQPLSNPTPTQTIYFTNVSVDSSPIPNKPFKITADIITPNANDLIASISAPSGISVTSPIVAKIGYSSTGTETATWTLIAGQTGSYSINLLAHGNFPVQDITYTVNVNVGTPNSLVITGIQVPGNIYPNHVFTVGLTLKNTGLVADSNVITAINVPSGLGLMSSVDTTASTMAVNEEKTFYWTMIAQQSGSFTISFLYSSTNSGTGSIDSTVNVGQILISDIALSKVTWGGYNFTSFFVGPGDQLVPLVATFQNVGDQDLYNINAKLLLTNPFVSDSSTGSETLYNTPNGGLSSSNPSNAVNEVVKTKNYYFGHLGVGQSQDATYYVDIKKDIATGNYPVDFKVYFSNGEQNSSKSFETPILISDTGLKISSVTVTPSAAYAGDTGDQITIQIFDSGLAENDLYATLELPHGISPAWGNATSVNLGRIGTFQTAPATFVVNVANNMAQGSYPMTLVIKQGQETTKFALNFVVSEKANFKLISVDDSQIFPGATGAPFKITLQNVGSVGAQTLTTKLLAGNTLAGVKSSTLTAVGNEENVGTILPGQSFTTTFFVDVDSDLSGDQSTTLEMDWGQNGTSTAGFVQTLAVPYHAGNTPYSLNYGGIPWTYVIIFTAVLVALAAFANKRRKRIKIMDTGIVLQRDDRDRDIALQRDESDRDIALQRDESERDSRDAVG